jgi:hypothetical protein
MYNRLILFINKNNILREAQNRFRKNKSSDPAIQSFTERIQDALDNGLLAIGMFFGLSKGYSILNHDILLDKLNFYDKRANKKLWFKS